MFDSTAGVPHPLVETQFALGGGDLAQSSIYGGWVYLSVCLCVPVYACNICIAYFLPGEFLSLGLADS